MLTKTPRNGKNGKGISRVTELPKITTTTDTREILAHAAKEARQDDYFIVDVDAHVTETAFWSEVVDRMDSDVYRQMARAFKDRGGSPPGLLNTTPGMLYQDVFGRIPHQQRLGEAVPGGRTHAQVTLVQRAMDSMGIDYMVVFPTPMLVLGMHPQAEIEVAIGNAFNKWLTEEVLPQDPRIKAMLYLPFNHPEECLKAVESMPTIRASSAFRSLRRASAPSITTATCRSIPRSRRPESRCRSTPASIGATSRCSSATASSPCTPSRSSITTSST